MVRYGMPTLFEADSVQRSVELCRELALAFVELNANFPTFGPQRLKGKELRAYEDVFFTIHLDDGLNIADFNPLVAEAYCKTVEQTIALAKEGGVKVLNAHLPRGAVYTLPEKKAYFSQIYAEEYLDAVKRFRDRCDRWVEGTDICVCIENADGFLPVQRQAVDVLLESPAFGLTLDIGHDHCAGNVDRDFVLARKDRLRHMHMHDARLPKSDHLPLGQGEVDVPAFAALAESVDATVVLEVKTETGLRQSTQWLNNK